MKIIGEFFRFYTNLNPYKKGLFVVLAFWGTYFVYIWPKMFFWGEEGIYAGWVGIWGDWAAHNAYASRFAYQDISNWIATHPLYIGTKFTYPFLANLISGLLIRSGIDRVGAFILPTLVSTFAFLFLLYKFYYTQLQSYKKAVIGVFVFLTSGGLGFWWYLKDLRQDFWKNLAFPPDQYTQLADGPIYWLNTITGQLVPQRALLIGMVIGLVVLIYLNRILNSKKQYYWKYALAGLITSLLVLAHMHSFIVLFFVGGVTLAVHFRKWKYIIVYALATGFPALAIYLMLYGGAIDVTFFKFYPGWLANGNSKNMNFIYFWILNWGFFTPLAVCGFFQRSLFKNIYVVAGLILFVITNLFLFQPFDWDNSKLFTWVYLFWTIPVVEFVAYLWNQRFVYFKVVAVTFVILLCFAGSVDIYRLTRVDRLKILMFAKSDIELATQFRKISKPDSVVLASDKHNHWVAALTGRQILLGYRGWMWTYGINDGVIYNDMKKMFSGSSEASLLINKYSIDYVVIGYDERANYGANDTYFDANYEEVLSNENYKVYKIAK